MLSPYLTNRSLRCSIPTRYPIGVPALYFYLLYIARDEIIKTKPELVTLEVLLPGDSTERQRSIREAHAALDTRASALGD